MDNEESKYGEEQNITTKTLEVLSKSASSTRPQPFQQEPSPEKPVTTYGTIEFIDSLLESNKKSESPKKSESLELINKIINQYELFRDYYGSPCATKIINGVKKTYYIDESFESVLHADYINNYNEPSSDILVKKAIKLMKHYANENPIPRKTYKRFAYHEGAVYLDLHDGKGSVARADKNGWEILINPPIEFIR